MPPFPPRHELVRRPVLTLAFLVALVAAWIVPAETARAQTFSPGNIVADSVFYDSTTMSAAQIDQFLRDRNPACVPSPTSGTPCLRDFRETTWTRTSTVCSGIYQGASNESAGAILAKVSAACGINPQVLLVTLQKEQSLVTSSGSTLTPRRYQIAMGFGCPDNALCDSQYYGFFNQVYSAAQQFERYRQNPSRYGYRAGATNAIGYNPTLSCGSSQVYIVNQATAGLYNYTPYQPNSAILNGGADACSSTGNYNFWRFFTAWFGSTHAPGVVGDFAVEWSNAGGASSVLGTPLTNQIVGLKNNGRYQVFRGGYIYASNGTGPSIVTNAFDTAWPSASRENGPLGYPLTSQVQGLKNNGSYQVFQNGYIYSTPTTGTHRVTNAFDTAWPSASRENGPLGYPTGSPSQTNGVTVQTFENGVIAQSSGGVARSVSGEIARQWLDLGGVSGRLGAPTSAVLTGLRGGGSCQFFERGAVYRTPTGVFWVPSEFDAAWPSATRENGPLGYPTANPVTDGSGQPLSQTFERGAISRPSATQPPVAVVS